ncbi:MAG: helix-turn-helix domain-containing protein [Eubacteriales bacterium]|nr:helix-turn-helix domain-containing protein [Eubacteriales bacterium]
MYITSEIIKDILAESFQVTEYGRTLQDQTLLLPAFYMKGTVPVPGGVYILRGSELPEDLRTACLYICFGSAPSGIRRNCCAEIFYLAGNFSDYLHVFNEVQKIYDTILQWESKMQDIAEHSCDIEEMLRVSIPIFENRIAVTDYSLRILAYCEATTVNGKKESKINRSFDHVPHGKSVLFDNDYRKMTSSHAPYHFTDKDAGTDNYCVNLFLDKEYIGTCSLMEDCRPIRKSDYLLFQKFSEYITAALVRQSAGPGRNYVTLKSIFRQLLESLPVSKSELMQALEIASGPQNSLTFPEYWLCITLQSANHDKLLPPGYLCSSLEQLLPECSALSYDGDLVCILPLADDFRDAEPFSATLTPMLQDMNFQAGCSLPFHDIFKLRTAYQQSLCALKTGKAKHPGRLFYAFRDYLLDYMLQNCCGSFDPEDLLIPELEKLRRHKGSVDYWNTLKSYLDHECNASETAQDMFLHRSSLLPRLKKIREIVDYDSAETRLLLRIYMHLLDTDQ